MSEQKTTMTATEKAKILSEELRAKLAESLPILGQTFAATKSGFTEYIVFSNAMEGNGYSLHSLVRLDTTIAATYRKKPAPKPTLRYRNAFDEVEGDEADEDMG